MDHFEFWSGVTCNFNLQERVGLIIPGHPKIPQFSFIFVYLLHFYNTGYPHGGCADKNPYWCDRINQCLIPGTGD